jgi:hypothetical protein
MITKLNYKINDAQLLMKSAFEEEHTCKAKYLVSYDIINIKQEIEIYILCRKIFLDKLWQGAII